jgi:hypothetical protein
MSLWFLGGDTTMMTLFQFVSAKAVRSKQSTLINYKMKKELIS